MNRNTLAALSLTASLSLTLAACGSGGGTAQSPAPAASTPPAASGAPSGGVEDGVLTVGMECAYAPYNWTQMDDSNGAVPVSNVPGAYANGYDVMIAQRICDANGWELEVVSTAWDSLIPALQSGTIDVAIAGQSMTADRMAQVDMAGPYYAAARKRRYCHTRPGVNHVRPYIILLRQPIAIYNIICYIIYNPIHHTPGKGAPYGHQHYGGAAGCHCAGCRRAGGNGHLRL